MSIEDAIKALPDEIEVEYWTASNGGCLYVNNFRAIGPKPWGGAPAKRWKIPKSRFLRALNIPEPRT